MSSILIPITALMIPIVIVPTSLYFKQRLRVRELEHAERIRAMELGIVPQAAGMSWPGAAVCLGIGAGVPVGSMLIAWLAMFSNDLPSEIFGIPLLISFSAIWAAKSLADRMMGAAEETRPVAAPNRMQAGRDGAKPRFDPDAYDVVGSRG